MQGARRHSARSVVVGQQRAPAARRSSGRGPRAPGARGSRRARRGRGTRRGGTRRVGVLAPARATARTSTCSSSRKRSTRPATRTRSPRSKRPASRSASRKARAGIAPVRSRSSSARYGVPERATRRSLRVHAKTPSTSSPGTERGDGGAAVTDPSCTVLRMQPLIWDRRPDGLRAPALVCAFQGWNDAGDAASAALTLPRRRARRDALRDDRSRGVLRLPGRRARRSSCVDGLHREIAWPEVEFYEARVPRAPRDLDPALGRRALCALAHVLRRDRGARRGARRPDGRHAGGPAGRRAHSRPRRSPGWPPTRRWWSAWACTLQLRGPDRHRGRAPRRLREAGHPSASLWAAVPHYVAAAPNPKARARAAAQARGRWSA